MYLKSENSIGMIAPRLLITGSFLILIALTITSFYLNDRKAIKADEIALGEGGGGATATLDLDSATPTPSITPTIDSTPTDNQAPTPTPTLNSTSDPTPSSTATNISNSATTSPSSTSTSTATTGSGTNNRGVSNSDNQQISGSNNSTTNTTSSQTDQGVNSNFNSKNGTTQVNGKTILIPEQLNLDFKESFSNTIDSATVDLDDLYTFILRQLTPSTQRLINERERNRIIFEVWARAFSDGRVKKEEFSDSLALALADSSRINPPPTCIAGPLCTTLWAIWSTKQFIDPKIY